MDSAIKGEGFAASCPVSPNSLLCHAGAGALRFPRRTRNSVREPKTKRGGNERGKRKTSCYFRALGRSAKAAAVVYCIILAFFCALPELILKAPRVILKHLGRELPAVGFFWEGYRHPAISHRGGFRGKFGSGDCHRQSGPPPLREPCALLLAAVP